VGYEWFYQQYDQSHNPEYLRISYRTEVQTSVLTAATDFWPLADTGRFAKVSVVFINKDGVASSAIVSPEIALDPNPGAPLGTFPSDITNTLTIQYDVRGGVQYYRLYSILNKQANITGFAEYSWRVTFFNDAGGSSIFLQSFEFLTVPSISILEAYSDWWPLSDQGKYARTTVRIRNVDNTLDALATAGQFSAIVAINANPGIDPNKVITLGNGMAYDSTGKLVSTFGGLVNPNFDYGFKDWLTYPGTGWSIVNPPDGYIGNTAKYVDTPAVPYAQIWQQIKVIPGKSYRLVVVAKVTIPNASMDVVIYDANNAVVADFLNIIPNGLGYQSYVLNFKAPANTAYVTPRVNISNTVYGGGGSIWVDQWDFFQIDNWDQVTLDQQYNEDAVRIKQFGVAQNQLKDLEVLYAKLGNGAVKDSKFADDGLDNIRIYKDGTITDDSPFGNSVIGKVKILDVYANRIFAGQIYGSSLYMQNSLTQTVVDIFTESAYPTPNGSQYGGIKVQNISGDTQRSIITAGGVACISKTSNLALAQMFSNQNNGGFISVRNSGASDTCSMDGVSGIVTGIQHDMVLSSSKFGQLLSRSTGGLIQLWGAGGLGTGNNYITLDGSQGKITCTEIICFSGNLVISSPITLNAQLACQGVIASGIVSTTTSMRAAAYQTTGGIQLIGSSRGTAVSSPSADVNSLKTAVDALINRLQVHGLIS
jgi:hypothetical protein